jgi:hypothetical protein
MILWVILGFGWLAILVVAVSLLRLAGYTDRKVRRFTARTNQRNDQAA